MVISIEHIGNCGSTDACLLRDILCGGDILFDMIKNKKKIAINKTLDVELLERQSVKTL